MIAQQRQSKPGMVAPRKRMLEIIGHGAYADKVARRILGKKFRLAYTSNTRSFYTLQQRDRRANKVINGMWWL